MTISDNMYTAESIDVLEGLEGVRKRPSVYVGDINKLALYQVVKEAVDNSIDEALIGKNDKIYIELIETDKETSILVADCGRGIPVENHPKTKISTLTTILTYIHAGGKFSSKNVSIGTHGIGISATNALSSKFEVWTCRARDFKVDQEDIQSWYYQKFCEGKPTCNVIEGIILPIDWKCGTVVKFTPDLKIFNKNYSLPIKKIKDWLYDIQFLCPNLEFVLKVGDEKIVYKSTIGLPQLLSEVIDKKKLECIGKRFEYSDNELQIVLQWTDAEEESIQSYVNCCRTVENGSHFNGFRKALNESLLVFNNEKYNKEDLRIGLIGVLNFKMKEPTYSTQTKEKLGSEHAEIRVREILLPFFNKFFHQNKNLTDTILIKAIKLKQIRDKYKKEKASTRGINLVSKNAKNVLPTVLAGAPRCKPSMRELFICEGKSAGGTLKNARDPSYQEILPLRGKFTNAVRYPASKVLQNEDIRNIFVAIGSNQNIKNMRECDPNKARVGKIILIPDEDEDGKHISCLLLSLIISYMKELISTEMIYVVDAPLYVTSHRDKKYFGDTLEDIKKQLPLGAKVNITRMKGWGECSTADMKTIAMNPSTRILYKVILTDQCEDRIEELMGKDSLYRKKLLGI